VGPAALPQTRVHGTGTVAAVAGRPATIFISLNDGAGNEISSLDAYRAAVPSLTARVVAQVRRMLSEWGFSSVLLLVESAHSVCLVDTKSHLPSTFTRFGTKQGTGVCKCAGGRDSGCCSVV
jgi:hypothetical protein